MLSLIRPANKEPGRRYMDKAVPGVSTIPHNGNDYGWGSGRQIYAAAAGVVQFIRWAATTRADNRSGGYGNYIIVDHGAGYATLYAHLPNTLPLVRVGQSVTAGELIAWMGDTGNASGVHLHFEVRYRGSIVDPNPFIRAATSSAASTTTPVVLIPEEEEMSQEQLDTLRKDLRDDLTQEIRKLRPVQLYTYGSGIIAVGQGGSEWIVPSQAYVDLLDHLGLASPQSVVISKEALGFLKTISNELNPDPAVVKQVDAVLTLSPESVAALAAQIPERAVTVSAAQLDEIVNAAKSGAADGVKSLSFVTVAQ